jgi:hypothetical protein
MRLQKEQQDNYNERHQPSQKQVSRWIKNLGEFLRVRIRELFFIAPPTVPIMRQLKMPPPTRRKQDFMPFV